MGWIFQGTLQLSISYISKQMLMCFNIFHASCLKPWLELFAYSIQNVSDKSTYSNVSMISIWECWLQKELHNFF